jgi:hypothetical protein
MSRDKRKIINLMQYGLESSLAERLVEKGFGVTNLRATSIKDLATLFGESEAQRIKDAITREPITEEVLNRLVEESDWSCCMCWSVSDHKPVIVHHLTPYAKTQDNTYENLVVLCPNHHAEAHSRSELTGDLLPLGRIKQRKTDFAAAIREWKDGKRPPPGKEPFPQYHWEQILANSHQQAKASLQQFSSKFDSQVYVRREMEDTYFQFTQSSKDAFLVIDRSGRGKTNFLCSLTLQLIKEQKPVVLLRGDTTLNADDSFIRQLCNALGYNSNDYQMHLSSVAKVLHYRGEVCHVLIDGVSENNTLSVASRSLANLLTFISQLGQFKVCMTSRDIGWQRLSHNLPLELFYSKQSSPVDQSETIEFFIEDFNDEEFDNCLPLYLAKYNVSFTAVSQARERLKHPLLLRIFCEACKGKTLGSVDNVPIADTFDWYLTMKAASMAHHLGYRYEPEYFRRVLRNITMMMWELDDIKRLGEESWSSIFSGLTSGEQTEVIRQLESEGIIQVLTDEITLEKSLKIVFDELREYLLYESLLIQLPKEVAQAAIKGSNFQPIISHARNNLDNLNFAKLLTLIGLRLPESPKRNSFLTELLLLDFRLFCDCIQRLVPVGYLNECKVESQEAFATELRNWYYSIATKAFPSVFVAFDPWLKRRSNNSGVAVRLTSDLECKEMVYSYKLSQVSEVTNKLVEIRRVSKYPVFDLSFHDAEGNVLLKHDPDNGIIFTGMRDSPEGLVERVLNRKQPSRFSGDSLNIPERMALWDIWDELRRVIDDGGFPYQSTLLAGERAWELMLEIPTLSQDNLTLDILKTKSPTILEQYNEDSRDYVITLSKLRQLERLLHILQSPLQANDHSSNLFMKRFGKRPQLVDMTDNELFSYLSLIVRGAIDGYKITVETNFPNLTEFLNIYVNLPSSILIASERKNVKLHFLPLPHDEEAKTTGIIIPLELDVSLNDPSINMRMDDEGISKPVDEVTSQYLKKLRKQRLGIYPFSQILPMDFFFGSLPMNNLVRQWLMRDFHELIGFPNF